MLTAQRPMLREAIVPKIDSIEIEADLLYHYVKAEKEALLHIAQSPQKNLFGVETLTYKRADSLATLFIKDSTVVYEVSRDFTLNTTTSSNRLRPLNANEKKLFNLRQKSLQLLHQTDSLTEPKEGFRYTYAFWPESELYKLHALITPIEENALVFTNSFYCLLNQKATIIRSKRFKHIHPYSKADKDYNGNRSQGLFLTVYAPFIYASDVCLFRLYKAHTKLEDYRVLSKRNKRWFIYKGTGTEIEIDP